MSDYAIALSAGLTRWFQFVGKDDSGTIRGATGITATISDTTDAYLVDLGGAGKFRIVPRQNFGGSPVSALTTVTVTVTGNDAVLGGALPPVSFTVDLDPAAPPPPHSTILFLQASNEETLASAPTDPGTATISVTV